jgi:ribosomal protein L22
MAEETKNNKMEEEKIKEEKLEIEEKKQEEEIEKAEIEEKKQEEEIKEQKEDKKIEEKKEEKKKTKIEEKKKRNDVCVRGLNLHISSKAGKHICDMIRAKDVDLAIKLIEEVISMKRAVSMRNREIGHRKGEGNAGGRYPIEAAKEFLRLLKQLKANAIYHELELEKARIKQCYTNVASKPYKRGGARAKRSHVFLKLEMKKEKNKENKTEKEQRKEENKTENKEIKNNKQNKSGEKK